MSDEREDRRSSVKHRWWQTRRMAAELHAATCRAALLELLEFVTDELDPDPSPWPAYFNSRQHQALAASLQRAKEATDV